jgi:hypothetical protein
MHCVSAIVAVTHRLGSLDLECLCEIDGSCAACDHVLPVHRQVQATLGIAHPRKGEILGSTLGQLQGAAGGTMQAADPRRGGSYRNRKVLLWLQRA